MFLCTRHGALFFQWILRIVANILLLKLDPSFKYTFPLKGSDVYINLPLSDTLEAWSIYMYLLTKGFYHH